MSDPSEPVAYLTDHAATFDEIDAAARLLVRVIRCTEPGWRDDPLTPFELAIIAGHTQQLACMCNAMGLS